MGVVGEVYWRGAGGRVVLGKDAVVGERPRHARAPRDGDDEPADDEPRLLLAGDERGISDADAHRGDHPDRAGEQTAQRFAALGGGAVGGFGDRMSTRLNSSHYCASRKTSSP